jgi:hypothetical protein
MTDNEEQDDNPKSQMIVNITLGSIIASAVNGIVGFIAIYFFKPVWEKIIKMLDTKQDYWTKK